MTSKRHPTLEDIGRSESISDRVDLLWKRLKFTVRAARNVIGLFGLVIIPGYLWIVGLLKLTKCNGDDTMDIPVILMYYGTALFFITLYIPCYYMGKSRALAARQTRNTDGINNDDDYENILKDREINARMPFRVIPIAFVSFVFLIGTLPFFTWRIASMYPNRRHCDSLVYWTSVVLCLIYLTVVLICLLFCICCCFVIPWWSERRLKRRNKRLEGVDCTELVEQRQEIV